MEACPVQEIVWAALSAGGDANNETQPGILRAYDASDVTRQLWNSQQNIARDSLGNFSKFTSPTVVNGKTYLATFSNKVVAYGLLAVTGNAPPVVNAGADQSIVLPTTATLTGIVTDDGNPNPPGAVTRIWTKVSGPGTVTFECAYRSYIDCHVLDRGHIYHPSNSQRHCGNVSRRCSHCSRRERNGHRAPRRLLQRRWHRHVLLIAPAVSRTDAVIDFAWLTEAPAAGVQPDNFSVRWTGQVKAPVTGDYRFSTSSNDGVR